MTFIKNLSKPPIKALLFLSLFFVLSNLTLAQETTSENHIDTDSIRRFSLFYQFSQRTLSDTSASQARRDLGDTVLPTSLTFQQHLISAAYQLTPKWSFEMGTVYLSSHILLDGYLTYPQKSIHIDSSSKGWSDLRLGTNYSLFKTSKQNLSAGFDVSVPTGSIEETDQGHLLPYSGQLGSGTWDMIPSLNYAHLLPYGFRIDTDLQYTLHTGTNSLNYRLGNQLLWNVSAGYQYKNWGGVFIRQKIRSWAASTDPRYNDPRQPKDDPYIDSGTRWETLAILRAGLPLPYRMGALILEGGLPLYRGQVSGEAQLETDWYFNSAIAMSF